MWKSLRDMGSFGQPDQIQKCPAHSQTDEEELGDELMTEEIIESLSSFKLILLGISWFVIAEYDVLYCVTCAQMTTHNVQYTYNVYGLWGS